MIQKRILIYTLLFFQALFFSFIVADTLEGRVVAVKDGDTIQILTKEKELLNIRLIDIDCPENKQAFGQKAKEFTSDFCFGKNVKIVGGKLDRYKRVLGYVYTQNGENLNFELVKNGLAWRYKYSRNKEINEMEIQARQKKLGLWADKDPIAPWDFRKMKANAINAL